MSDFWGLLPKPIPINAMIGDSQAAAVGEGCYAEGQAKATLGTGCSVMMNTGSKIPISENMLATICFGTEKRIDYGLEGIIVSCGATLEWIRKELGLFTDVRQTEAMANAVTDNNGVYIIPAFSGLGTPHWQMDRKASISGLTFGSSKNHIVRAALESIPYQIKDVIGTMELESSIKLQALMIDGGISVNGFVVHFLANLLQCAIHRIDFPDVSALGAAYLAGLQQGIFPNFGYLMQMHVKRELVLPNPNSAGMDLFYTGWKNCVAR